MPFIIPERRKLIDAGQLYPESFLPGDRCYVYYKKMVAQWRANPRWSTAYEIYKSMCLFGVNALYVYEERYAKELAWQCFFYFHVLPYEEEKRKQNGDI